LANISLCPTVQEVIFKITKGTQKEFFEDWALERGGAVNSILRFLTQKHLESAICLKIYLCIILYTPLHFSKGRLQLPDAPRRQE